MINLNDLSFLDILPNRITDEEMKALAYAIDPELQEIAVAMNEALIYSRIDELEEELVDLLAWQFHVDFYEPLGLDLDKKRALVKNSLDWHRRKGTKSVVEEIIRLLFFEDSEVEEWFEYGGEPHLFRLLLNGRPPDSDWYQNLLTAVNETKSERSWLEGVSLTLPEMSTQIQIAGHAFPVISTTTLTPFLPEIKFETNIYTAAATWSVSEVALRDVTSEAFGALLQKENGEVHKGLLLLESGQVFPLELQEVQANV